MSANKEALLEKIARAEAASKSGLLANYAPARTSNEPQPIPMSWGPAMRK